MGELKPQIADPLHRTFLAGRRKSKSGIIGESEGFVKIISPGRRLFVICYSLLEKRKNLGTILPAFRFSNRKIGNDDLITNNQ